MSEESLLKKLEEFYLKQLGTVEVEGKVLKKGITTGTVATALSYSAALNILLGENRDIVKIRLANNDKIDVLIEKNERLDKLTARAKGYKYAGDDIDVTNLALLCSKVTLNDKNKIEIKGGQGVGRFTRDILENKKGSYAINKGPIKAIKENLEKLKEDILKDEEQIKIISYNIGKDINFVKNLGFEVEISVRDGEILAKKTFNPRLKIEGGISILGTTGIVMPMSENSLKESIKKELASKSYDTIALTFGNMGEKFLINKNISRDRICLCSNFIGYSIRQAAAMNFKKILIAGHIGKMVKIAGGIFNTHSHVADARVEILIANLALLKAPYELIYKVSNTVTAQEAAEIIQSYGYEKVFDILAQKAADKSRNHSYNQLEVEAMIFDIKGNLLGKSKDALNFKN